MGENFLQRWSRRKAEHMVATPSDTAAAQADGPVGESLSAEKRVHPVRQHSQAPCPEGSGGNMFPTMEDVARLDMESDFSSFVAKEVDQSVRRAAFKKLFSDPHFNVMDGLDIYIDDYNKTTPLTPSMLASLAHTKNLFGPAQEDGKERDGRINAGSSEFPETADSASELAGAPEETQGCVSAAAADLPPDEPDAPSTPDEDEFGKKDGTFGTFRDFNESGGSLNPY